MIDLIKIFAIFGLIIFLLRLKWNFGIVMLLASAVLGILFNLGPPDIIRSAYKGIIERTTINLALALTLILVFENILRKTGTLKDMMTSMRSLIKDSRVIMAAMPALIGLLPSIGGAAFSAPMVDESASSFNLSSERKAFINYWFRHPWEYILPLYPGIVLASAIIMVPIGRLALLQLPLALGIVLTGIIWGLRGIGREIALPKERSKTSIHISLLPVATVVILVLIFRIELSLALGIVILGLWIFHRYRPKDIFINLKEGISLNVILLVLGVMVFKALLKETGAVATLPDLFGRHGIPIILIISFLPFLVGLLTGLTVGFVGITFPMIIHLFGGSPSLQLMVFAFGCGYVGVLLSPVHVCLILTKEYFHADLGGIYRKMIIPSVILLSIAFGIRLL